MRLRTSCLLALMLIAGCATTPAPDRLRVLVYNIHAGKDAGGVHNVQRVSEVIVSSRADVVLLQEVDRKTTRSGGADHLAELQRLTRMHGAYGKSLDFQGGEYGIAVLSRWPITPVEVVALRTDPPQPRAGGSVEPRVALVVETNGMSIINTHFDASNVETYRLQEVEQLLATVKRSATRLTLIGGDFNSGPGSAVYGRLRDSGLRDAFLECRGTNGLTYPADSPVKRIDYLFLTEPFRCVSAEVLPSQASDHRALFVEVSK
jgi:endonuclease/exonuclease/phosphatase family metal-dependent hydrolase